MSSVHSQGGPPAITLFIIRLAIVAAVMLFAGVTWYVRSQAPQGTDPSAAAELAWPILGVQAVMALGLIGFSWMLRRSAPDRGRVATFSILGWGMGEAAAFAGLIFWFITGSTERLGFGLLVFAAALLLFRIPPD
jgi:Mn2+/Fe2+ NRAMP family transporter